MEAVSIFANGSIFPAQNYGNVFHKNSFLSIFCFYGSITLTNTPHRYCLSWVLCGCYVWRNFYVEIAYLVFYAVFYPPG